MSSPDTIRAEGAAMNEAFNAFAVNAPPLPSPAAMTNPGAMALAMMAAIRLAFEAGWHAGKSND